MAIPGTGPWESEAQMMAEWHAHVAPLLGKRVRVKLAQQVVQEGVLLGFGDGGDVELRQDDGLVHHCWPLLAVEEAPPVA
jgi:biotin-(acetyl-CoA carboxylase) ligase